MHPECDNPICGRLGMMLSQGPVAFSQSLEGQPINCTWDTQNGTYRGRGRTWPEALDDAAEREAADER